MAALPSPTLAATIDARDGIIYVTGVIGIGDADRFAQIATDPPRLVVLNSAGGEVANALAMAKLIHDKASSTLIPVGKKCLSACSVLFLAGRTKYMGSGAQLGVHSAWDDRGDNVTGTSEMAHFVADLAAAPLDMIYAMTMTPPDQMWILPRDRWDELHITEWTAPLD